MLQLITSQSHHYKTASESWLKTRKKDEIGVN
jgi:hypothetical protein